MVFVLARLWRFVKVLSVFIRCIVFVDPEGRPRVSDVILLSGISRLSFDSPFLSPPLFLFPFFPSPLALSVGNDSL